MKLTQKQIATIKIFGFILMIGIMVVLNDKLENEKGKDRKAHQQEIVYNGNDSGITPGTAAIPEKAEGNLPLRLISKTNSNFLMVINNCQHFTHVVKYQYLQKSFLSYCTKIHHNFITEFLATIRNKDYK